MVTLNLKILGIIVAISLAAIALLLFSSGRQAQPINSFNDCKEAGYTVKNTYPAQCTTPDGRTFTQNVEQPQDSNDQEVSRQCGIQSCHGLDISCGSDVPQACTAEYKLGDFCRQYASCKTVEGTCQFVESEIFTACKSCVEKCENGQDPQQAFKCESKCREQIEGITPAR